MKKKKAQSNNRVIELGFIDKGTGKHQSNVVYSIGGVAPCVMAMFSVKQPPTMIVVRSEDEQISERIKREH